MTALRHVVPCLLLFPLATLAGCAIASGDFWQGPSVLGKAPPDPPKTGKREAQGGFSVVVEAPGQPTTARAIKDIGDFAQRRGFVREGTSAAGNRYVSGKIVLDVSFRASDSHVVASLHGFGLGHKFAESFYHDFDREYARQYGEENPIFESDFVND